MQIREKLAAFREQDTEFRERMGSLSDSVSELTSSRSSLSSFTPSEHSDLGSVDEASKKEEEFEQQTVDCAKEPSSQAQRGPLHQTICKMFPHETSHVRSKFNAQSHRAARRGSRSNGNTKTQYILSRPTVSLYPQYNCACPEKIATRSINWEPCSFPKTDLF